MYSSIGRTENPSVVSFYIDLFWGNLIPMDILL